MKSLDAVRAPFSPYFTSSPVRLPVACSSRLLPVIVASIFAMPVAHVFRWRNGLAIYFKAYSHREDALRDLGVSEDDLEPITP